MKKDSKVKKASNKSTSYVITTGVLIALFTLVILIFSVVMAGIASVRNEISSSNFDATADIYYGEVNQYAPRLNIVEEDASIYKENQLTKERVQRYVKNTFLTKTSGDVVINADFVKKGLMYQPTYETDFKALYTLTNTLDEESFITFQFPFPANTESSEISNAKLIINGEEVENTKTTITISGESTDGLIWSGKIQPNSDMEIEVSYSTVGLSKFVYEGIENPQGSQDLDFKVTINGTRSYNVLSGLSVDDREFGDNTVTLLWNKPDLYSKPVINIEVGDKLNPSEQVSRIYLTMAPIYLVFVVVLVFLASKFGSRLKGFDLFLMTILFAIFFPLVHYLSSFTIDPTVDSLSFLSSVTQFSMPLYGAFLISWITIAGLMYYLIGKTNGFNFASKFGIPSLILFIGFFPLVVTVPQYSILLVLIGAIALMAIIIQVRIKLMNK